MKKLETSLLKSDTSIMQMIHLTERFKDRRIDIPDKAFDWGTQDCFLIICEFNNRYLIGKLKKDYEFCPNDWDFLTPHAQHNDEWKEKALWTPKYYARLKPTQILKAYHTFLWLDLDSQLWWHFIPFKVGVKEDKFTLDPNKKYSGFKWVKRRDIEKYSRQRYFTEVCRRTLDVDNLYIGDYTTIHDINRGYYNLFPHRE